MRFSRQAYANTSRKPAPEGNYVGIICGFCDLGFQEGQYGQKQQVMIRWELRNTDTGEPVIDDENKPFTTSSAFPATVNNNLDGVPSRLAACLAAHAIEIPESGDVDSQQWKGHAAMLDVGTDTTGAYSRVLAIAPLEEQHRQLGREGKLKRVLPFDHWEGDDKKDPPGWAWGLLRMGHLEHRVPGSYGGATKQAGQSQQAPGAPRGQGQGGTTTPPATGSRYKQYEEDEDIPF